jgi:hypothetical protein
MADLSKLARRRLGPPPPMEEASATLQEPETAPLSPISTVSARTQKIDARTLRKTGRTIQFATRVSEDFDRRFREVARRDGLLLAQLLEKTLEAYEFNKEENKLAGR